MRDGEKKNENIKMMLNGRQLLLGLGTLGALAVLLAVGLAPDEAAAPGPEPSVAQVEARISFSRCQKISASTPAPMVNRMPRSIQVGMLSTAFFITKNALPQIMAARSSAKRPPKSRFVTMPSPPLWCGACRSVPKKWWNHFPEETNPVNHKSPELARRWFCKPSQHHAKPA